MREFLFRGEWTETGDWVKGFYVCLYDDKGHETHRIYPGYSETDCGDYYPDWYEVDPETVGRFTGLTDNNGKKIFEGDVLDVNLGQLKRRGYVIYENSGAKFGMQMIGEEKNFSFLGRQMVKMYNINVIGNIHDNPEMLGK